VRKITVSLLLLSTFIITIGCSESEQETYFLELPSSAAEVQFVGSVDGLTSELVFKVDADRHDNSSGQMMFNQLKEQPFTSCAKNSDKWARASSMERSEAETHHKFVWFLKSTDAPVLATIAINQACFDGKQMCKQVVSTRFTRYPWWVLTRRSHISSVCG